MENTTNNDGDFNAGDMMKFLKMFQQNMDMKLEDTKKTIETTNEKIDVRLNGIDTEVKNVTKKIVANEEKIEDVNRRMDQRLSILEDLMKNSARIKRRSNELRDKELNYINDSTENILATEEDRRKIVEPTRAKIDKVDRVTHEILTEPVGTFRSSWAQGIQKELLLAAKEADRPKEDTLEDSAVKELVTNVPKSKNSNNFDRQRQLIDDDNTEDHNNDAIEHSEDVNRDTEDTPTCWEDRWWAPSISKARANVVRKPATPKDWFGFESSSDESEEDTSEWTSVDRKKKEEERRRRAHIKKDNFKKEVASRAANMISMGPVSWESVIFFKDRGEDLEEAKKSAVKEYLRYNLNYSWDELNALVISETRMPTRGDAIINIAFGNESDIRELYSRKAESRNDNLIIRNYVPPNFHERFMFLNKICAEKRMDNPQLKTQLRFGKKDVEVYTKLRGDDQGFKKVHLEDFTETKLIPKFDAKIKWRRYKDKIPRIPNNHWEDRGERPSTRNTQANKGAGFQHRNKTNTDKVQSTATKPVEHNPISTADDPSTRQAENILPVTRQNSNSHTSLSKKQKRYTSPSSSDDEVDMEDRSTGSWNQSFATPSGEKQ